jgi:Cellulose binding domain/Type II transport protein GspH
VPRATQRASAPSSAGSSPPASAPEAAEPLPAQPSTGPVSARPVSTRAGRAVSANRAIGVGYAITEDSHHGIHGEIVIANNGSAAVSGWRVTIVLPGDTHHQVLDAGSSSAGDALVMEAPVAGQRLSGGSTELIVFTAQGSTSTPVRFTFTDAARPRRSGHRGSATVTGADSSRGAGGHAGSGHHGRHGNWLGGWLKGGWLNGGWPGGREGGWAGQHHGWPGGR